MKKEYVETIPEQKIKHKLVICDNSSCETVITDNGVQIAKSHYQTGDGRGNLVDFCSERCSRKTVVYQSLTTH